MAQPVEKALGGKYEILQKIREGGMGAIYKVRHRLLDEIRIIKVLKSELAMDKTLRQRFQNEARFAIQLRHPNIAHLYDFSVSAEGKSAYIVMEFIDGVTVQELIAESGAPTVGLGVEIACQGLKAVSYLHHQGFVHRDIAPDNLMLTRDFQGNPLVKLIDLGIAKGQSEDLNLTKTGIFMGKVRYAPPELFKSKGGANALDERSDIYSFGVLLYELLTGKSPFDGETFSEIVAGHLFRPPRPFDESDPDGRVPAGLRELCLHALAKDPEKRLSTAEEFISKLSQYSTEESTHADELDEAIAATTQLATFERRASSGSTQSRLDRQFGVGEGTGEAEELEAKRDEAVGYAATAIREKSDAGNRQSAKEDLDTAITLFGEHEDLADLRRELGEADRAAPEAPIDPALMVGKAGPKGHGPALASWLRSPLGLLLIAGLVLIAGGLLWALGLGDPTAPAPRQERMLVEAPERWQPAGGGAEVGDPLGEIEVPEPGDGDPPAESPPPATPDRTDSPPTAPPGSPAQPPVETTEAEKPEPPPTVIPPQEAPPVRRGELFGPDPGVTPPSLLAVPEPVYGPKFDAPKKEMELLVEVLVSEEGSVIAARLAPRESGKRRFKELAVETAKGASFRPATKYGVAGKMWTTVRVRLPAG